MSNDIRFGQALEAMLEQVQLRFDAELTSEVGCVNQLVEHVGRYRGKMLRPTLVLVSAMATVGGEELGPLREPTLVAAAVCEMVHMATLVHDDVLDEAAVRRRGATVNQLRGNEAAVMLGDYLISHAYHLCSSLGQAEVSRAIAHATNTVCEGELLQLANRHNTGLTEEVYFEIVRRKTGALCGVCCEMPVYLSPGLSQREGQGQRMAQALFAYGEKLGVAFQIVDDILDLSGDEQSVGKSVARDLVKGKLTLPVILHLAQAEAQEADQVTQLLAQVGGDGAAEVDAGLVSGIAHQVAGRVVASGAMDEARACAKRLVDEAAAQAVAVFDPSPARDMMQAMANAVVDRRF